MNFRIHLNSFRNSDSQLDNSSYTTTAAGNDKRCALGRGLQSVSVCERVCTCVCMCVCVHCFLHNLMWSKFS